VKDAEEILSEALKISRQVFGPASPEAARAINLLAVTIALDQTRLPEAIGLYREAFDIRERLANPEAGATRRSGVKAGLAAVEIRGDAPSDQAGARALPGLDAILAQREPLAEIEGALREAQQFARSQYAKDSWEEAFYLALTSWVLLQEKKFDEAEEITLRCLAIRLKLRPDDWSVFNAQHLLGAARAGQKRSTEAESLLIKGYEGMRDRAASIPPFHQPRLGEAVLRIVGFYAGIGRTDQVAKWQAEFNQLPREARQSLLSNPAPATPSPAGKAVTSPVL